MIRIAYRLLIILMLAAFPARAEDALAVIMAADTPLNTISLAELKLIYLRKNQIDAQGNRWIPLNLPVNDPLRRRFSLTLFSLLPEAQDDYWNVQYFNGINPPKVMGSEEAVLRFVATTQGSIAYVRQQSVDPRVKVLRLMK